MARGLTDLAANLQWNTVMRHVVLLYVLTFLGGVLIGMFGAADDAALVGLSNVALMIVGFAIAGSLTPRSRPLHLSLVAVLLWLVSLTNLFFGYSLEQWFFGGATILLACGAGGGISALLFRP